MTVRSYVEAAMIERARALLARGVTVAAVAQETGFASTASFSFAFRRATGRRPSEIMERGPKRSSIA
jgi:AraC-like DNA-binding protein